jgi:hypothetical protein
MITLRNNADVARPLRRETVFAATGAGEIAC